LTGDLSRFRFRFPFRHRSSMDERKRPRNLRFGIIARERGIINEEQIGPGKRRVRKCRGLKSEIKELVNYRLMFYGGPLAFPLRTHDAKRGLKTVGSANDL